ncbi:MAG: hypothetical protein V4709_14095 [Pseudomonadota bacterium]
MSKQPAPDLVAEEPSSESDQQVQQQQGEREQDERNRENEQHDGSQSEQQSPQWTGEEMSRDEHGGNLRTARSTEAINSTIFDQRADDPGEPEIEDEEPADEDDEEEEDEEAEEAEQGDEDGKRVGSDQPG